MGILSNFIGGAAQAGGEILQRDRESATRRDEAQFSSDLAQRREETIRQAREDQGIRESGRQVEARRAEEAYQATPERINQMTAAERLKAEGILGKRVALAPKTAEATQAEFDAGKVTRDATQKEKLSFALDEYRQKSAAEIQAEIDKTKNPEYLAGVKREADAKRDHSGDGERKLRVEAMQIALNEKKAEAKMPPAAKNQADVYKEQFKAINKAIYDATASGTTTPDGLSDLRKEQSEVVKKIEDIYRPYLGDKAPPASPAPKPAPPPDGTRGKVDGVMGEVINGQFVPDGAKPAAARKTASPPLPRTLGDVPGAVDKGIVASGLELMPPDRARLFGGR